MENNYSLSDLAAITNGSGIGGGNGIWLLIILFFIIGGGGFWGNRGGDYGQYATAASQQEILFGQRFSNLDNKIDRLGNGIADATFALNNTIVGEGRATQAAVGQNRFDMANYNAATLAAIHEDGEKTRALIQQNKIEALQEKVNQLQLQAAMCGVVRYPTATTYTSGGNPFCGCGCGCGNAI